jgi:hypothetical protein
MVQVNTENVMNKAFEISRNDSAAVANRRWFPRGFGAAAWVLLAGWAYFIAVLIATNAGLRRPHQTALDAVFYCSSVVSLWASPIWLILAGVFVVFSGWKAGTSRERVKLTLVLVLTVGYFAVAAILG